LEHESAEYLKENFVFIAMLNTLNSSDSACPFFSPYFDITQQDLLIKLSKTADICEIEEETFKKV
jgi:hypothetical protein